MGYALLGHGGLELAGSFQDGMEMVAIDAGTTLQVYTDAGQSLLMNENDYKNFFSKVQAPWPAMDSTNVTLNLELTGNDLNNKLDREHAGFFVQALAPHTPLMAGKELPDPALLCTGDKTTCPTDPRMITGEVDGPTAHTCDGILGKYKGELFWMACTVVYTDPDEDDAAALAATKKEVSKIVDAARGSAPASAKVGYNPDNPAETWYFLEKKPSPDELDSWFDEQNETVKAALRSDPHIAEWERAHLEPLEGSDDDDDEDESGRRASVAPAVGHRASPAPAGADLPAPPVAPPPPPPPDDPPPPPPPPVDGVPPPPPAPTSG